MKPTGQQNNVINKLCRKDDMDRLKRKIQEIKGRKPQKQKEFILPKLQYKRSLLPQRMEQILTENKRLNSKINQSITLHRRSDLNLLSSCNVNKAYNTSDLQVAISTVRNGDSKLRQPRISRLNKLNASNPDQQNPPRVKFEGMMETERKDRPDNNGNDNFEQPSE